MTTNNPEVKRYTPAYSVDSVMRGHLFMEECERGAWVSLEDHEALQAECEKLRKDAETEQAIQRAAEVLPPGYRIEIEVEKDAGSVALFAPGAIVECDFQGGIAEQIADAIDAAMQRDIPC